MSSRKSSRVRAVDNISQREARIIFKKIMHLNPFSFADKDIRTRVRKHLRDHSQSPAQAIATLPPFERQRLTDEG